MPLNPLIHSKAEIEAEKAARAAKAAAEAEEARRQAGPVIERDAQGRKIYEPDGDTLCDFIEDRSHVSIIRGSIGSGTSSASMMKLYMIAMEQRPNPATGVRHTRWGIVRNCFDDQTEILTEKRGWRLFRDLVADDRVAQLNGDRLEFVEPTYHYAAPYVGQMVGFRNEGVDFLVTPDHRLYVSRKETRRQVWGEYGFRLAKDIEGQGHFRVRRDAAWEGQSEHSEAFFRWLGFWFAEGTSGVYRCGDGYTRYQCVISQVKTDGVALGRRLFAEAGLAMTEAARPDGGVTLRLSVLPHTKWLIEELSRVGHATDKRAPQWIKDAPAGHLAAFLEGYIAGDGHIRANGRCAYTSSRRMADDLQEIALRAGWVANVASRDRRGQAMAVNGVATATTAEEWTVSFVRPAKFTPSLKTQGYAGKYPGWYRQDYAGMVYCIEVPTHVVYVRRGGKAHWSSQTYPDLKNTTVKTWLDWFPEEQYGRFYWDRPFRHVIRLGDMLLEAHFFALDSADDIRKMRSLEVTGWLFNELEFIEKDVVDEAESRTGRFPAVKDGGASWDGILADMNAPREDHWVPLMMGEVPLPESWTEEERLSYRKPDNWAYFVQPPAMLEVKDGSGQLTGYRINPNAENVKWLKPGYYEEKIKGKSKQWIDSRVLNKITVFVDGKPVWQQFNTDTHVSKTPLEPIPGWPVYVGLDFGRHPAAVFGQLVNNRWRVFGEVVAHDVGASIFAPLVSRALTQRLGNWRAVNASKDRDGVFRTDDEYRVEFWGDPKGADGVQTDETTAYDIFRANDMPVQPAPVKNNHILTRINTVENAMITMANGAPRFVVCGTHCRTLKVACEGGYHFARIKGTARHKEEPEKDRYSDIADATQYMMLGAGEGRAAIGRDHRGTGAPVSYRMAKKSRRRGGIAA